MPELAYATSGPGSLYNAIGWFDFSSLPSTVTAPYVTTLVNSIKGGGTMQATFTFSNDGGLAANFTKANPPTWSGAAFGNTAYLGITVPVCLRDSSNVSPPNYSRIIVSNIELKNKYGEPITNYNLYFLDSETAGPTDLETFITNGGVWSNFYTMPNPTGEITATLNGIGTQTVSVATTGNTPIITTTNPTSLTMTLAGQGAMTLGMSLTMAQLVKVVNGRINPSDQFKLDIIGPNSGTTTTIGQVDGVQEQGIQVISGVPGYFIFTETMSAGSISNLSLYNPSIQVSNLNTGGTILPSSINLGSGITLNNGDQALVTITNAPDPTTITVNKTADKQYSDLNQIITYTISIENNAPYTVRNIIVKDTIPSYTSLVPNSLTLNGSTIAGSTYPPVGVTVGTLSAGGLSTITFKVLIDSTLPNPNVIINNSTTSFDPTISIGPVNTPIVLTTINTAILSSLKNVDKSYAKVGDIVNYNVVLQNTGSTTANNIIFIDTIPNNTSLVTNSFKQYSTTISGSTNYVTLPNNIPSGSTSTINYQIVISNIPTPNPILNSTSNIYSYSVIPTIANSVTKSTNSNIVSTQINNASLNSILKSCDKNYAKCGDILTFTITLPNNGNVTATNVFFIDTIPSSTSFVPDSLTINGVSQLGANPQSGILIGNISSGNSVTITFKVIVNC